MVADIVAPKLSVMFRGLIRSGSFPVCWRSANVAAVPKGPPSRERELPTHIVNSHFVYGVREVYFAQAVRFL